MHTAVVGAGPTGLYTAIALARRGHEVTAIDRDPGPDGDESWNRRGVMQFHHPHAFRQQVGEALLAEMPEVWDDLITAGAEAVTLPDQPGRVVALRCRRLTFERVLRRAAEAEPGVTLRTGHVDDVCRKQGHAVGVRVDGHQVDADLVIDASGRAGRLSRAFRGPAQGGDCGISYVSRQYQLFPGAQNGPMNSPIGIVTTYPGYLTIVFPHDNRTFSTLIARASTDRQMAALRFQEVFEAASRAIPSLAAWTEPDRSRPITPVLPGGRLYNTYRGQLNDAGQVTLDGLIFVGDAVCTTNPSAGRGIATSLVQAHRLVGLLDEHRRDFTSCSLEFDHWCAGGDLRQRLASTHTRRTHPRRAGRAGHGLEPTGRREPRTGVGLNRQPVGVLEGATRPGVGQVRCSPDHAWDAQIAPREIRAYILRRQRYATQRFNITEYDRVDALSAALSAQSISGSALTGPFLRTICGQLEIIYTLYGPNSPRAHRRTRRGGDHPSPADRSGAALGS